METVTPALKRGDAGELAEVARDRWAPAQLCPLLTHRNVDVRRVAAVTLGLIGDGTVVSCLAGALHDDDEQVNEMAEHGLWAIWFRSGNAGASRPFREGVTRLVDEQYGPAIDCFKQATELDPTFAEAFNQCAIAHFFVGQWHESIAACSRTIKLMPQHFGAVSGMGHCYTQLGELGNALRCYRHALRINPRMPAIATAIDRLTTRFTQKNDGSGEFKVSHISEW